MTRRRWIYIDGVAHEVGDAAPEPVAPFVQDDIKPFVANTGAYIEGARQWRNHLKERNCEELGHSDLKARGEEWAKKREKFKARLKGSDKYAPPREVSADDRAWHYDRPRVAAEVLNRLHGRPTPHRKELIKLTLDVAKRIRYGR